jgi:hypothetical protein
VFGGPTASTHCHDNHQPEARYPMRTAVGNVPERQLDCQVKVKLPMLKGEPDHSSSSSAAAFFSFLSFFCRMQPAACLAEFHVVYCNLTGVSASYKTAGGLCW